MKQTTKTKRNFLVLFDSSNVRDAQVFQPRNAEENDGDPFDLDHETMWGDWNAAIVCGIYAASSETEAISIAATKYDVYPGVLIAYELAR